MLGYAESHPEDSFSDIARATGCTAATVSTHLKRAETEEQIARRKEAGRRQAKECPRFADITGMRSGKLVVIRRGKSGQRSGWICRCDCGREYFATKTDIMRGIVKSCGKCPRDTGVREGDRFGALTVLHRTGETDDHGRPMERWVCRCDCGNEVVRISRDLRDGHVTSCGCGIARDAAWRDSFGLIDGTSMSMMTMEKPTSNKSGVKGVFWDTRAGKWHAKIKLRGKEYDLGKYSDLGDAADARKYAERELFDPILEEHGRPTTSEGE